MRKYFFINFYLIIWLSIFTFFMPDNSLAQNFNITTFTTRDGLSHNNVKAVATDSSGYLWIATWDGLSRYDGYSFKNYYHDPNDSLSLPYFSVYDVMVDGGNNLWILTDIRTVAKYDRDNDIFTRVDYIYDSIPGSYISMSIDESGFLWLVCMDKVFRFDFRKNEFTKYDLYDSSGTQESFSLTDYIYSVSVAGNNEIWLAGENVFEFEKSSGDDLILKKKYRVDRKSGLKENDFNYLYWYRIYHSGSGKKWIVSNGGLFLLDEEHGVFREFRDPFPSSDFRGNGYLCWSWYDDGLYIYDQQKARLSHIPHDICQLPRGVFCQNSNLVWFSNSSMTGASLGLNRVVFTPDYFNNYPLPANKNDIPAVYAITTDKQQRIWAGMRGKNQLFQITSDLKVTELQIPKFNTTNDPGPIRSLTPAPDGLWIGFFRELLLFYNFAAGEFTRYNPESRGFRPIAIDKKGDLYLCGNNDNVSIIRFSPHLKKIEEAINYSFPPPVYKILIDKKGIVWAGLNNSHIIRFDPASKKTDSFTLSRGNYNIEDICDGDNGDLWFTMLGGGVCNFDPATGRKKIYTTSDGLANNMTYCVLKDDSGNIWVSTNTGISRINPQTGIIRTFGLNEGLNIIEFNSGASTIGKNGEFFMGGMGGFVGFFPDKINKDELEAGDQKIMITELRVSGEPRLFKGSVSKPDTVILKKGENNFMASFSSTDFVNSDKTVYRYKLSKINENWIEADSRSRNCSYANLNPGWYNFQVQGTDRSGSWNASKELRIRIQPLFHQTLFFRISFPLAFTLLITCIILVYIRQLKQREAQKQATLRLQSLRGQMNPHFIFNSLNSINYFISNNDKLSANRYIADFSKLIRSILHNLSHDFISLEKEIESIEDYLKIEYLRFGDKFEYEVRVDKEIDHTNLKVSPGMIQPFIENAIWHGVRGLENRKGKIEIWFGMKYGRLICVVKDDGIGRKRADLLKSGNDRKKSKGISIVLERMKIINGLQGSHYQIVISDLYPDKPEAGTMVEIDIPIVRE